MKHRDPHPHKANPTSQEKGKEPLGDFWVLTAQIKNLGPNRTLWAPLSEDASFRIGDRILGESEIGPVPMELVESPRIQGENDPVSRPAHRFIRFLDPLDVSKVVSLRARESSLMGFVRERSAHRNLGMQIVDVTGNLSATEFVIYYTAEGRVDFRELVKDIHANFRGRHELRQISPREHAALFDGLGPCGRPLCCSTFLKEFKSVTTRQARDHDPEMNPMKTTGMCGRLKCCLSYEKSVEKKSEWVPVDNDPRGIEPTHFVPLVTAS
jgi:cell fate regulator YaaT (PSP1 superfamily)